MNTNLKKQIVPFVNIVQIVCCCLFISCASSQSAYQIAYQKQLSKNGKMTTNNLQRNSYNFPKNYKVYDSGVFSTGEEWQIIDDLDNHSLYCSHGLVIDKKLILPCNYFLVHLRAIKKEENILLIEDKNDDGCFLVRNEQRYLGIISSSGEWIIKPTLKEKEGFTPIRRRKVLPDNEIYYIYNNDDDNSLIFKVFDSKGTQIFNYEESEDYNLLGDNEYSPITRKFGDFFCFFSSDAEKHGRPMHKIFQLVNHQVKEIHCSSFKYYRVKDKEFLVVDYNKKKNNSPVTTLIDENGKVITDDFPYGDIVNMFDGKYFVLRTGDFVFVYTLESGTIIPYKREYTKITYNENNKNWEYIGYGIKGICDINGNEISRVQFTPTMNEIKKEGGYKSISSVEVSNTKCYIISNEVFGKVKYGLTNNNGRRIRYWQYDTIMIINPSLPLLLTRENEKYGLLSISGKEIVQPQMDNIERINNRFMKLCKGGFYGIVRTDGKEIIPTNRGYTSISDFDNIKKTFAFTMKGYRGICDALGHEISKTKLPMTANDIKENGGYSSIAEMKNGNTKYYKVCKNGRYGLTDAYGKVIIPVEMEYLGEAGNGYLKFKLNDSWGIMNYAGRTIIPSSRGYTSIGSLSASQKTFAYTMNGYKGECNAQGRELSRVKVKVDTPSDPGSSLASKLKTESPKDEAYDFSYEVKTLEGGPNHLCLMKKFVGSILKFSKLNYAELPPHYMRLGLNKANNRYYLAICVLQKNFGTDFPATPRRTSGTITFSDKRTKIVNMAIHLAKAEEDIITPSITIAIGSDSEMDEWEKNEIAKIEFDGKSVELGADQFTAKTIKAMHNFLRNK